MKMKKKLLVLLTLAAASTSLYSQSVRQPQSKIVNQQSKIATIEGSWILDSAIIETTDEDGYVITSIYLLGDTLMTSEHPQPPQRVVITAKEVIFEYSSPISYRTIIKHVRKGKYTFDEDRLWICFTFAEEFICHRRDDERLHLHYICYLTDGVKQFKEYGVFKLKAEKSKDN
jgi:hypothetical protein